MIETERRVLLVGAGPGDPELISVKGMKAIQKADVILYDALISRELLFHARPACKLIYVGKRKGKKEFSQEEINSLLVFYARRVRNVVRLKGGDPNVFGRAHEELEFVTRHGIQAEIIPGITSATAAPNEAGIPLTKRGVNESFWVVTGTLSSGQLAHDISLAAKSTATVVVLMGLVHLEKIAQIFSLERSPEEPVAIIQEATLPGKKIITGTAIDIVSKAQAYHVTAPAIIVIGKVVEEAKKLNSLAIQQEIVSIH